MPLIQMDAGSIRDWDSFHDLFATSLGFPGFYGRNLDAWIDCMSYLDEPSAGMTGVYGSATDPVTLALDNIDSVPATIYKALVECAAFVNWRQVQAGQSPMLILAYNKKP